jgi:hypothetical protein
MSDFRIVIPSRSRHNRQKTIFNLSIDFWPLITIVVPEYQYTDYREHVPQDIEVVPCTVEEIAPTREFILNMRANGKVIVMDDDLAFYKRTEDGRLFKFIAHDETKPMVEEIVKYLDTYTIVGIADKAFSNSLPRQHKEFTRFNDLHGYNRDTLPVPWPSFRWSHGEEHDFALQVVTRGRKICALTEYSKTNAVNARGGCSDWRTNEKMKAGVERLAREWPGLITLTPNEKQRQGYNVRFNWKEAKRMGGM